MDPPLVYHALITDHTARATSTSAVSATKRGNQKEEQNKDD